MTPAPWLTAHRHLLPSAGDALDVACGQGRNTVWLAELGLRVHAVDRDADAVRALGRMALERHLSIRAEVLDLEAGGTVVAEAAYDLIVVVHYLHRALVSQLVRALRPGGVLVYETFTTEQAARGKPTNPDFLLQPGELRRLVEPLDVLAEREGEFEGRMVASVIARAPRPPHPR